MTRIIAVANQKGGVAKTTTAVNLASGLLRHTKRVLLVDLDPQANATDSVPIDLAGVSGASTYELLERSLPLAKVARRVGRRLDVVPSHIKLARLEPTLSSALDAYRLKEALLDADHDFVILDCPPSLGPITINALVAATDVIVPVKPATFGLKAVADFMETFTLMQRRLNPDLKLLGILITMMDSRTSMAKDAAEYFEATYKDMVFKTRIRVNVRLDEAASAKKSIFAFDPRSSGKEDYEAFVQEVLERVS